MRKYLFSMIYAAVASAAWAQSPVTVSPDPVGYQVLPAGAASAVITSTSPEAVAVHSGQCEGGSCVKTKTVCVSQPATVTKTKVLFSSDCETKCHKAPFQFLKKGGDCTSCPEGKCGHSYVTRSLYKRVETTVCDSYKCVPTQVPVCQGSSCPATCAPTCATSGQPGAAIVGTSQPGQVMAITASQSGNAR
jgi:hypothetical protein